MSKQKIIAGIDVGTSKTTTIIGSGQEEGVKIIGVATVPSLGIRKGQIVDIEEASKSIVQSVEGAERMAGYSLEKSFLSIGGAHIASQNSKGVVAVAEPEGEITAEDVTRVIDAAQAISLPSSKEVIHVLPRYFTVDGQEGVKDPVGMTGVRLEVETHIITGSSTAIRNLTKCVADLGIDVSLMVCEGLAAAESVLTETEKELGVVLVDIGGGTTSLVVFVEGAPFFTSVLPIGAKNVTNDLAVGLRLSSLETAERLKIFLSTPKKKIILPEGKSSEEKKESDEIDLGKLGISSETKTVSRKTLVEGIIKPRLNEIFTMIGMEVKRSQAGGLTPAGVVLCGGGAQTIGSLEVAKKILAMPVRIGIPEKVTGLVDDIKSAEFAASVGLVLYGQRSGVQPTSSFSLKNIGKKMPKVPFKGMANKALDLIKSFLP